MQFLTGIWCERPTHRGTVATAPKLEIFGDEKIGRLAHQSTAVVPPVAKMPVFKGSSFCNFLSYVLSLW